MDGKRGKPVLVMDTLIAPPQEAAPSALSDAGPPNGIPVNLDIIPEVVADCRNQNGGGGMGFLGRR